MSEPELYHLLLMGIFACAGITFVAVGMTTAPYGRHGRTGWGPTLGDRLGWVVMESPAAFVFAAVFFAGPRATDPVPLVLLAMWLSHYVHRSLWYPLRRRSPSQRRIPVTVVLLGMTFNVANAYLNARWLTAFGPERTLAWLVGFRFLYGALVFVTGFVINRWADAALRKLRRPGDSGYAIPRGGLYDEISCPNYFGELLMWTGWAIATWSLAGVAFAVFTAANLVPRAVSHHRWYHRQFPDYPRRRRAIIPYVL